MALINHPALAGKLVHAWLEPAKRDMREHGGQTTDMIEDTRFRFVLDESDAILGVVSDRYSLVRNAELVAAADIAADERGIALEPLGGKLSGYNGGRSKYTFTMPSMQYRVGMDPSNINPMLTLRNDYRGGGGLVVQSGFFRHACTNGMVFGKRIAYHDYQRHVGKFDLLAFVGAALDRVREVFDADRLQAEVLANTPIIAGGELLEKIMADTAKRYQPDLERAVRENAATIGENAWAYLQAAAEVATHRMQERSNFNLAADPWVARIEAIVREHAEIK